MERWASVNGTNGKYEISDQGRVRSNAGRSPRILRPTVGTRGYMTVNVYYPDQTRKRISVHVMVAEAFVGPRPNGQDVRHKNGLKMDCRASNLEYGTRSQNMKDAVLHGQNVNASKTHCGKCGTAYDEANTYVRPDGGRECRTCAARRRKAYEQRKL